jgi:hypothetical protein
MGPSYDSTPATPRVKAHLSTTEITPRNKHVQLLPGFTRSSSVNDVHHTESEHERITPPQDCTSDFEAFQLFFRERSRRLFSLFRFFPHAFFPPLTTPPSTGHSLLLKGAVSSIRPTNVFSGLNPGDALSVWRAGRRPAAWIWYRSKNWKMNR